MVGIQVSDIASTKCSRYLLQDSIVNIYNLANPEFETVLRIIPPNEIFKCKILFRW